jgi:hypothetical protein
MLEPTPAVPGRLMSGTLQRLVVTLSESIKVCRGALRTMGYALALGSLNLQSKIDALGAAL